MNKSGSQLVRYALEQLNIQHTFGVLGAHNRDLYNALNESTSINTHLVNQELSAAFMADAISRTTQNNSIGAMLITADAIISQGIAEAFISGVPLLIIAGSSDHQNYGIDSQQLLQPLTKACFKITEHEEIVSTIFAAHKIAISDKPGPVFIDIPIELQVQDEELDQALPVHLRAVNEVTLDQEHIDPEHIDHSAQQLLNAEHPAIYCGWKATSAQPELIALAEFLAAPVCNSLQGASAFPAQHPLHAGLIVTPSAKRALKDCDALLLIGTASHDGIDLDYAEADLPDNIMQLEPKAISALLRKLQELHANANEQSNDNRDRATAVAKTIAKYKNEQKEGWLEHNSKGRVNPAVFFDALANAVNSDAIIVTGHGTHRTLAAELLPINNPRGFICPTSFNAMGYCVPAVNAIKLANPSQQVVGIVGDGAMIINGLEALTAAREKLGIVYCLFNNSQPNTEKNLGHIHWDAFADALECGYFPIANNNGIDTILRRALETAAQGQPVIIDVSIDYSRKSYYAQSEEKAAQDRLPSRDTLEIVKRAIVRKIMGARAS
ncbi:thiamine pyrophosphate-binding protein [Porticoccaceae bacterium]|nr:thiamine pyrophosphate-binding protein [Porticoccaceae bacterium]